MKAMVTLEKMMENRNWKRLYELATPLNVMKLVAFSMASYHIYKAYFGIYEVWRHRGIHLIFMLLLAFMSKGLSQEGRSRIMKAFDFLLIGLSVAIGLYMVLEYQEIQLRAGVPNLLDKLSCIVLAFLVIVASLRTLGVPMTSITVLFVLYVLFGSHLPGIISYTGCTHTRLVDIFFNSTDGILGLPTGASAVYVAIFIYFGTFLLKSGAADYFRDISLSLAGAWVGGPPKVAVLASASVGTMMGSGVANIATTGSFTIPMMINLGYKRHFAAAVEAAASMGGQIMPPIMASVIFIIAEFTGVPLYKLLVYAFVPALMYFLSIFWGVHFEALRTNLPALSREELTPLRDVLFKGPWYLLLPLPVLVVFLFVGYSPFYSAFLSIIAVIICSLINPKTRMGPRKIVEAMIEGSLNCIVIGIACGAASIIVGAIGITGLGLRFSSLLIALSGGKLLFLLILAMCASLLLGMGVGTTVAAYIIVATLTIPALVDLGLNKIAGHLFCFYYAILCGITPPVAIGAFVAAGIAKAGNMKTAVTAMKLGIMGLVVPFLFVYDTSFLLMGPVTKIVPSLVLAFVGIYVLAAALQGYLKGSISVVGRAVLFVIAIAVLWPNTTAVLWPNTRYLNLIGLAAFGGYYISKIMILKKSIQVG